MLVFRLTLPKLKLAGLAPSAVVAATAVPVSVIVSCAGDPLVVSTIEPFTGVEEGAVGVKTAWKVALLPAAIVVDVVSPLTLNPAPVAVTCENVSVAVPVLLIWMLCELLLPTTTFVKLADDGVGEPTA